MAATASRTIAVLSPGEMGSQIGLVLREAGVRVVTCLAGRGPGSKRRAREAGIETVPDLDSLVQEADMVLSVVPPAVALPLAGDVAEAMRRVGARRVYLDANSIGPHTARQAAEAIISAGGEFVDGAIIGSASDLRGRTTFYLSGAMADMAGAMLAPPLRVAVIGREVGQASGFKVLYAGLTKGMSALGMELLAGAQRLGLLDQLMDKYRADHPSVARFLERNLPGLPSRAARRAQEMAELEQTLADLGLGGHMARAAQATLEAVAGRYRQDGGPSGEKLEDVVTWWTRDR